MYIDIINHICTPIEQGLNRIGTRNLFWMSPQSPSQFLSIPPNHSSEDAFDQPSRSSDIATLRHCNMPQWSSRNGTSPRHCLNRFERKWMESLCPSANEQSTELRQVLIRRWEPSPISALKCNTIGNWKLQMDILVREQQNLEDEGIFRWTGTVSQCPSCIPHNLSAWVGCLAYLLWPLKHCGCTNTEVLAVYRNFKVILLSPTAIVCYHIPYVL